MTLDLQIEQLVLHGFDSGVRREIAEAVQRELALLLAADPAQLDGRAASVLRLDAGDVRLPADAPPDVVGTEIARAVHRGLQAGAR